MYWVERKCQRSWRELKQSLYSTSNSPTDRDYLPAMPFGGLLGDIYYRESSPDCHVFRSYHRAGLLGDQLWQLLRRISSVVLKFPTHDFGFSCFRLLSFRLTRLPTPEFLSLSTPHSPDSQFLLSSFWISRDPFIFFTILISYLSKISFWRYQTVSIIIRGLIFKFSQK